jgi:cell division protease FtsH
VAEDPTPEARPGEPTGLPEPEVGPVVSPTHGRRDNPDELTRKPLAFWDRVKLLIFFSGAFLVIVWAQLSSNPLMSLEEAERTVATTGIGQILLVLVMIEALRQIHFLLAEHVASYHQAWLRLFERTEARTARYSSWTRFRIARVLKWFVGLSVLSMVLAAVFRRGSSGSCRRSCSSSCTCSSQSRSSR